MLHPYLVELVLSQQPPRVLAAVAHLRAEGGCVRHEIDGQLRVLDDLLPEEVGQRHLRGGDQKGVVARDGVVDLEQVVLELGQLTF